MRRGRPSHTRSVVRAPLALLLVPSFRTWIPVARAPCFRLLSACAPPSSQQELKAHLSLCSGPSTGFPSRAEQTAELSWGVRGSTCSGPRDRSAAPAAPPESLRPRPWPHSVCLARASGPWRFACGLDTPPATPAGLSLAPSLLWLVGPELHFCWDPCLPAAPPLGPFIVSFPSRALTAF